MFLSHIDDVSLGLARSLSLVCLSVSLSLRLPPHTPSYLLKKKCFEFGIFLPFALMVQFENFM